MKNYRKQDTNDNNFIPRLNSLEEADGLTKNMWGRDSYRRPVCKGCTNDWWCSGTSSDGGHISSIWKKLAPRLSATTKDTKEEEAKSTARFYKLIIMYPNKVCTAHHITWIGRQPHIWYPLSVGVQPPSSTCDIIQLWAQVIIKQRVSDIEPHLSIAEIIEPASSSIRYCR